MTIREMYERTIKPLPAAERFQLATVILNDISPESVVDYSEDWSDEDVQYFTRASWRHVDEALRDNDGG